LGKELRITQENRNSVGLKQVCREDFPYQPDTSEVFASIADQPFAAFLDSGRSGADTIADIFLGRFDILVYQPDTVISTRGEITTVHTQDASKERMGDPFAIVQQVLDEFGVATDIDSETPFVGGALGYFAYDLGRQLEDIPYKAKESSSMPDMQVGVYDSALVFDHQLKQAYLVGCGSKQALGKKFKQWRVALGVERKQSLQTLKVVAVLQSNMNFEFYRQQFMRVKKYIYDGDVYQINLAQRWHAKAEGNAWEAYRKLRASSPAPFSAFLNFEAGKILSNSPERFVQVYRELAMTAPIKGTRARSHENIEADRANAEALANSAKDQAENLMIVDLIRNDFGRVCKIGSVKVEKLFELQSFANVHHLVSTITGQLAKGKQALDLVRACFPGGSVTGAPKVRAMEIIEKLEPDRRGVYCGSIAYISFNGNMDSNIAIRTLVHEGGQLHYSAGGGLVHDSQVEAEFQESLLKAGIMKKLISNSNIG
jgi:para-aminobenzoate synthetase component 1